MSDLWLAAGEDAERDRYQHHLAMARTAAADSMAFALGAATPEEFEHRLALVSGSFDAAVATAVGDSNGFLDVRVALLDEVNADFGRIHAAREAEAAAERQRIAARRQTEAEAARKVALNTQFAKVAYGSCPYCGQPGCSPNCPGPQSTTVCPECGAGASVHNGEVKCNDPDGCGYGWDGKGYFDDSHNAAKRPPTGADIVVVEGARKQASWSRTRVAAANREVPTWTARAHNRDLVVIAINQGFTWAVYGDSDEPLAKGRAAKLEMAQRLAHTAAA